MNRIIPIVAAIALGACQAGTNKPDMARIAAVSQAALTGVENAVVSYSAGNPLPADVAAKIQIAEAAAEAAVKSLPTVAPADVASTVNVLTTSINAVVAALPKGAIPAPVVADIAAVEALAPVVVVVATPPSK